MNRLAALRLRLRGEAGIAMVTVIGITSVLALLMIAATATAVGSMTKSANDANWNAALAAAYAGIEDYQNRISDEPSYVKYGNPDSEFSNPHGSPTPTVQLPPPSHENPAFGVGEHGTWAVVPGSDDGARYRYEVDNSVYSTTGTIKLRATGAVGSSTRSIVANLRQTGFIDFLYFTDYEIIDPDSRSMTVGSGNASCPVRYEWAPGSRSTSCMIQFASGDVIKGPLHSNDTMYVCSARFEGVVTTGNPSGNYLRPSGCSLPTWVEGPPVYSPSIVMPPTNSELKRETRTDLPDDVPRPGCLYTGPTSIRFISGGRMIVKSPWTKFTNVADAAGTVGDNSNAHQCGSVSALQSSSGATIAVPENNVIYVQNIPLSGANGASTSDTTSPGGWFSTEGCRAPGSSTPLRNNLNHPQNVVGYPVTNEKPPRAGTAADTSYGCRNGDVFIEGELSGGAVTVAAENYVYVTGNLTYQNNERDMLGLIGNNSVYVHNPVRNNHTNLLGAHRRIDAAILSVEHTFAVQNYDVGNNRGTLTVNGAIAQRFRGPVGTGSPGGGVSTGYAKDYVYDGRFRYTAPPKFLSPVTTTYGVNVWVEVSPVFDSSGRYR